RRRALITAQGSRLRGRAARDSRAGKPLPPRREGAGDRRLPRAVVSQSDRGEGMKPLEGKEILILAGPEYEDMELQYPRYRLAEAGARVTIAGIGEQTYRGKKGMPVDVDVQVGEVRARDFDALVIPGGYAPDKIGRVPE